jgi:subtilisin-like proprotein convertase family protein
MTHLLRLVVVATDTVVLCSIVLVTLTLSTPASATGEYTGPSFTWRNNGYDGSLDSMGSSSITVPRGEPGGDTITGLSVELDGWHTWVGDMTIKLAGPAGVVTLVSRPGLDESGDDGMGCCGSSSDWVLGFPQTFVDGAAILAEAMGEAGEQLPAQELQATGVFDGLDTPLTSLIESFAETSAVGEWTLYIGSSQGGDLGKVDSWTLHVTTGAEPVPAVSEWGLVGLTLILLSAGTVCLYRSQSGV